jgi:uncharacterized protein (DUF1800 family)
MARVPVYRGPFGRDQAERLLWRAGFGPRPGEVNEVAKLGLTNAVHRFTRPRKARLRGPSPTVDGQPLAPYDAWGHDMLWWLDRMLRSNQQGVERMALIWHDWFATGDVGSQRLGIVQNKLFRRRALGSFSDLLYDVTIDPAMLLWLSGAESTKWAPNENYARELMELFTLGASDGSYPYTEDDVREQARALTGWTNDWDDDTGPYNFHFDPHLHDKGRKRIFKRSGDFDWRDSCKLVLHHAAHAPHFVAKLWSYFIPVPPPQRTAKLLERMYVKGGYEVRPLVEAILMHPLLYEGPALVKPPMVQIAGMMRARRMFVSEDAWVWVSELAGQRPFDPPNVAGWDETRWLDTSTFRGRWIAAGYVVDRERVDSEEPYDEGEGPAEAVAKALAYWDNPNVSGATKNELGGFAQRVESAIAANWERSAYRALRQNALRLMVATSPDSVTC